MCKKLLVIALLLIATGLVYSQTPTAEELLRRVDNDGIYTSIEYEGEMIIVHGGRRFVKTMKAWARGNADSFIEFTNPEDRGTKYLKLGGRLFMISPDIEKAMPISGHMLKESMMGSDMSYEDTINNDTLASRYNAVISGSELWNGRDTWALELTAKRKDESYPKRRLLIDKETGDLLRTELYALSGARLKEQTILRIELIGGRRFPVELEVRDLLRKNSKTSFVMRNVILDRAIPDSVFSRQNLER
jgi:outer membrane lipoprotein-sorting protein